MFNVIGKKNNQTSVSDADREIRTLGYTYTAVNSFLALFVYSRVEISLYASVTDERFYLSLNPQYKTA